ncbi:MAG TPA: glycosyltransferase family 9 protein [Bradyrhizobium sp.]|nr:glycosyltransferase family 9 protein [Bradyrhizobium sp.]
MLRLGEALVDFSDTTALISHLDLVISVDTSIAHLADALGKPVWILLTQRPTGAGCSIGTTAPSTQARGYRGNRRRASGAA